MTEAQKYQKKKNTLIMTFMLLLVVFVGLICYIFIYAKMHPKKEYDDPSTIEIKEMLVADYQSTDTNSKYTEVIESTNFTVKENNIDVSLKVNENKEIVRSDTEEKIEILLNDTDINNNIKIIYQTEFDNLILTEDGKLYRLLENVLEETNTINVGQILSNIEVKDILEIQVMSENIYVLTNEDKAININTQKEYDGIVRELTTNDGVLYVYDDYSITFEKGKVITDTEGNNIKFNILFDNKLIDTNSVIYEIDFENQTISTSSLGTLVKSGYGKSVDSDYNINIETNTGIYNFTSSYYYNK